MNKYLGVFLIFIQSCFVTPSEDWNEFTELWIHQIRKWLVNDMTVVEKKLMVNYVIRCWALYQLWDSQNIFVAPSSEIIDFCIQYHTYDSKKLKLVFSSPSVRIFWLESLILRYSSNIQISHSHDSKKSTLNLLKKQKFAFWEHIPKCKSIFIMTASFFLCLYTRQSFDHWSMSKFIVIFVTTD